MNKQRCYFSRFCFLFAGVMVACTPRVATVAEDMSPSWMSAQTQLPGRIQEGTAAPQAQRPPATRPAATRPAGPLQNLLLKKPDLVLTQFSVTQNAWQTQGLYASAPFQVTVRNAGTARIPAPFYVTVQYANSANPAWRGETDGNNCFRVTALLDPNQTYVLSGMVKLVSSNIADQTLRLRALADFTCFRDIPSPNGDIDESNENNNASNEVSISTGFMPNLTRVDPDICIKGIDTCRVAGLSLGSQQGNHTVVVTRGTRTLPVTISRWGNSIVQFKVPEEAEVGESQVYIAESGSLNRISNELTFKVAEMKPEPWDDLLSAWARYCSLFSLRLHTWAGGPEPNNQSQLNVFETVSIDVPKVEINNSAGHYRFLLNDMNSETGGMVLSKENCTASQLRLNVSFESQDKELIGYYKVLGPAGQWRRAGAPDIEIDNGRLGILFSLYSTGGTLNYNVSMTFNANVHASNSAADSLMDLFLSNWDQDVKDRLWSSVRDGLMKPEIKAKVTGSLTDLIRSRLSLPKDRTICKMEFTKDAIKITSY